MLSQRWGVSFLACLLLLATRIPNMQSRRGGGFRWGGGLGRNGGEGGARQGGWGGGFGHAYRPPPAHSGGSSSSSSAGKIAGAAAAGALGGMLLGHGLGSMARPGSGHGYGYGGYGSYGQGYGGGYGHPRHGGARENVQTDEFRNETDMEFYAGSASRGHACGWELLLGAPVSLSLTHWLL